MSEGIELGKQEEPEPREDSPSCADEGSPHFIPDAATCRWISMNVAMDADRELHRANLYPRGQDRACAKARLEVFSRIMKMLLIIAGMIDSGEWPPKPKEGEKEQSLLVTP